MLYRYTHSMPRFYAGLVDTAGDPVGVLEPGATVDLPAAPDDPWFEAVDATAKATAPPQDPPKPAPPGPALEQAAEALLQAAENQHPTPEV